MVRLKSHGLRLKKLTHWLMIFMVLAGLLWLLYILSGRALCIIALRQIGELTNTKISHEAVDFHADGSVFIRRLIVRPYEDPNSDGAILKAEAVYARFGIGSLFLLKPQLKVININEFVLNARYDLDTGKSNLSGLEIKRPKSGTGEMPRIDLQGGTLQYTKISSGVEKLAISMPFNMSFGFDDESKDGYSFEITTARMTSGFAKSRLTGLWKKGSVMITGGISSADVPELEMAWTIGVLAAEFKYDRYGAYSLDMKIKDLQSKSSPMLDKLALIGPAFLEKSHPFAALQKFFDRYKPYGRVDIELQASGDFNQFSESTLTGEVLCHDVGLCYYKFPYAFDKLTGRIDFTKNSIKLNNLNGRHNDVKLSFDGWSKGFGLNQQYDIRVTSDRMSLDEDLYSALGSEQKEFWSTFSPKGYVAIDYRFSRQPQSPKNKKLVVKLLEAEALYRDFPYPLKDLTGELSFYHNEVIFSDLVSKVDDSTIVLNGQIEMLDIERPVYDVSIKINNLLLDSKLQAAFPERQRKFYDRLNPSGLVDGWVKVSIQDTARKSFTADLSFNETSLGSDLFPLPISDISAKIFFTPEEIVVNGFSGQYDHGLVSMSGKIWPNLNPEMIRYDLLVNFEQAQLNDNLFGLLPNSVKEDMPEFTAEGNVNITADLDKSEPNEMIDYLVTVNCLGNSLTLPQFKYPINDMVGTLTLDANNIKLDNIVATLGNSVSGLESTSQIKLNGQLTFVDNTFNSALLQLQANDIAFDENIELFLPEKIRPLYNKIAPEGKFDLDFDNVSINCTEGDQKMVGFDGDIAFENCSFRISDDRTELDANVETGGMFTTNDGFNNCQAVVDGGTLKVHGKVFKDLETIILFDPHQRSWSTQELMADFYEGKLTGKFEIRQLGEMAFEYLLQAGFNNVNLKQFLSDSQLEQNPEDGYSSGKMNGSLSASAQIGDVSSRIGTCILAISSMEVGKLSPLAKLLQVLQLNEPKDFAFDRMFVDSYIRGNNMFVEKLDLSGQSHAFTGSGRINLKSKDINLALTARGRRSINDSPSFLQSLTEGLSQAVVRMEISGSFNDPVIATKTLPVIEETLQILGTKPVKTD